MSALPRRGALGAAAAVLGRPSLATHPDRELLAVCAELAIMKREWQRLWSLTSDGPDASTPADRG